HIGQHVRSNQVTDSNASSVAGLELLAAFHEEERIAQGTADVSELSITEDTSHPPATKLPIVADTNRSEPTDAAQALIAGQRRAGRSEAAEGAYNASALDVAVG